MLWKKQCKMYIKWHRIDFLSKKHVRILAGKHFCLLNEEHAI